MDARTRFARSLLALRDRIMALRRKAAADADLALLETHYKRAHSQYINVFGTAPEKPVPPLLVAEDEEDLLLVY
jgi:hypothetical protein